MKKTNQVASKSIFYNLIYWGVRFRAGFIALVLVLASVFIYQYWQELTQNSLSHSATIQTNASTFTIYMPERSTYDSSGIIADIRIVTESTGKEIADSESVTIEFTGNNLDFEPPQIILSKPELTGKKNTYNIIVSSVSNISTDEVNIGVSVTYLDQTKFSIEKVLLVENKLKNPIVFVSGLLSFLTAILSFIIQIRNILSKQ